MVTERLQCPFCGGKKTTIYARESIETRGRAAKVPRYCAYVVCLRCGGSAGTGGDSFTTPDHAKEKALEAWNKREGELWG